MRHLLTFIASALMVSSPLVASQRPVYLRCDFKGYKGNIPSGGAVDITLDERNGTVVSKIWDLPIEPTDIDRIHILVRGLSNSLPLVEVFRWS